MLKKDVPQDQEVMDGLEAVYYSVDENGRYVLASSVGWDPANLANLQAWDAICDDLNSTLAKVRQGVFSPLAFHMVANQMDEKLLAKYMKLFVWQVRRHLKPGPFAQLKPALRKRYSEVLLVTEEELTKLPEDTSPTMLRIRKKRT